MSLAIAYYMTTTLVAQSGDQRNNAPNATTPHTENKPRASKANPSAVLPFFEEDVEEAEADDPLAVPLPGDEPVPVPCGEPEEGLVVGAGDATLKECQIGCQEQEPKLKDTDCQQP